MSTTYKKYRTANNEPMQVDSAIRDGAGKNIENNYAKQNGYYQTLKSGESDLANNIKTDKGAQIVDAVAQFDPISQAVEDGSYAKMDNMKGRSFAYNQLAKELNSTNWQTEFGATASFDGGIATLTPTQRYGRLRQYFNYIANHKILFIAHIKLSNSQNANQVTVGGYGVNVTVGGTSQCVETTDWQVVAYIAKASSSSSENRFIITDARESDWGTTQIKEPQCFDLTAMGLDSITTLDEALAALRSYGIEPTVYNEYSAGKIIDSKPTKIISHPFNVFNVATTNVGKYVDSNTGALGDNGNYSTSDYIKIIPGATYYSEKAITIGTNYGVFYYDENKAYLGCGGFNSTSHKTTIPYNVTYIRFSYAKSATDVCLNVSNDALNGTFKAYANPDEHAIDCPVMRSAGSVVDTDKKVNVGTFTYSSTMEVGKAVISGQSTTRFYIAQSYNNFADTTLTNSISSKLKNLGPAGTAYAADKQGYYKHEGRIYFKLAGITAIADAKAFLDGTTFNFELVTPTDQPTPISLPQNIKVWNGGSLETQYEAPNTTPGLISLTYQANIKNYIEGEAGREDINWNPDNVVSQEQLQEGLAPKADVEKVENGEIKAGIAKSLDTEVGRVDETPFSHTTVGIETDVETGFQELRKLVCVDVVKNQLKNISGISNGSDNGISWTKNDNKYFIVNGTATANTGIGSLSRNIQLKSGHKYLLIGCPSGGAVGTYQNILSPTIGANTFDVGNGAIYSCQQDETAYCTFYVRSGAVLDNLKVYILLIDLTQRYGNNDVVNAIIGTGTDAEKVARLLAFDPEILSNLGYDAGTLVPSKTAKLKTVDYNQFDIGTMLKNATKSGDYYVGTYSGSPRIGFDLSEIISHRKQIGLIVIGKQSGSGGGTPYFQFQYEDGTSENKIFCNSTSDSTYTYVSDASKVLKSIGVTYGDNPNNTDVMIKAVCAFIYWDGSRIGYEPYQEHIYDMPNYEGHGILKVVDGKVVADGTELYPDGNSKKRYTIVDLETLEWEYVSSWGTSSIMKVNLPLAKKPSSNYVKFGGICDKYSITDVSSLYENTSGKQIALTYEGVLVVVATSSSDVPTGYLVYPLATEEDIETDPFNGNPYMDDFGTMEFQDENSNTIPGLQGCEILYKANVSGFAESLYVKTDGDPDAIALVEDVEDVDEKHDALSAQLKEALGGTLRQLLAVKESIDFADTSFVDLGDLSGWSTSDIANGIVSISFTSATLPANNDTVAKIMCSQFKSDIYTHLNTTAVAENLSIGLGVYSGGILKLRWNEKINSSTNTSEKIQQALKGVLLAYEKASS